jgi:hypothetical protein
VTVRCFICGTRRATFTSLLKHRAASGHTRPCTCPGYWFPHRPGSPECDVHPYVRLNRARRAGADAEERAEALLEDILFNDHSKQPQLKEAPF